MARVRIDQLEAAALERRGEILQPFDHVSVEAADATVTYSQFPVLAVDVAGAGNAAARPGTQVVDC